MVGFRFLIRIRILLNNSVPDRQIHNNELGTVSVTELKYSAKKNNGLHKLANFFKLINLS